MQVQAMHSKDVLSPTLDNYMMIIHNEELKGGPVKASTIADIANVTRATVTRTLKALAELGYINYSPYAPISFTEKGLRYSIQLNHKSLVVEKFLSLILNVHPELAKEHALPMLNAMPDEILQRLKEFTLFMSYKKEFWTHWPEEVEEAIARHKQAALKQYPIKSE